MRRLLVVLAALTATLTGCAAHSATDGFELAEFSISGPGRLAPGPQSLAITNTGEFAHTLVVTDDDGRVVASTELVQPGEVTAVDLDLVGGQYQFTCRIVTQTESGSIVDHFEEGMALSVAVGG